MEDGGVTLEKPNITVENVEIDDMATTGISAIADNITLNKITVQRSGLQGLYEGDKVSFELQTGRDGKVSATDLTLLS